MSDDTIITSIRLRPHTAEQLERMKLIVNAVSISDMIRRSIELSDLFINAVAKGGSVIIQDKKGKQKEIMITGINS